MSGNTANRFDRLNRAVTELQTGLYRAIELIGYAILVVYGAIDLLLRYVLNITNKAVLAAVHLLLALALVQAALNTADLLKDRLYVWLYRRTQRGLLGVIRGLWPIFLAIAAFAVTYAIIHYLSEKYRERKYDDYEYEPLFRWEDSDIDRDAPPSEMLKQATQRLADHARSVRRSTADDDDEEVEDGPETMYTCEQCDDVFATQQKYAAHDCFRRDDTEPEATP